MKKVRAVSLLILMCVPILALSQSSENVAGEKEDNAVVHPVITKKPKPKALSEYEGPAIEATVVLLVIFRSSGKVTDIKVKKVIPEEIPDEISQELQRRCIEAAEKIKFKPAIKDGRAVSMYMQLEYSFHLQ